jgi:hypothetical protein
MWIGVLLLNLFRDIHEVLRPGFVDELAHDGTVYGRQVSDSTLLGSGLVLVFLVSVVVLARILPRRSNRRVNVVAAALMASGVLASWPKDPDDLLFGAVQLMGVALVVTICARWRDDVDSSAEHATPAHQPATTVDGAPVVGRVDTSR